MNNSLIPNSPDAWKGVVHIYEVHNSGPNKLPNADVMLQIPILFRETRLVFKRDIEVVSMVNMSMSYANPDDKLRFSDKHLRQHCNSKRSQIVS